MTIACKILLIQAPHTSSQHTSKAHIRRVVLSARVPVAQLAVAVVAPALDTAPAHYHARVVLPQGNGDSRVA
jgi:hypothetical protein